MTRADHHPRLLVLAVLLAAGTTGCLDEIPASERGAELFADPGLSPSRLNEVSCAHCHGTTAEPRADERHAGATMWGVARRERYWGGQVVSMREAVDQCLTLFMRSPPLDPADLDARALHEYLTSLGPDSPGVTPTLPLTIIEQIEGLPDGDAVRGRPLYEAACQECHGALGSGEGRLEDLDDEIFPEYITGELAAAFPDFPVGLVVVEKVRHGGFITTAGVMPPFSIESLSDVELADIVAYLGVRSLPDE